MVIGRSRQFAAPISVEQRLAWSTAQTYPAVGNALNGAKSYGLDSCPMGGFDPAAVSEILAIPAPLVPVMLCPIGYGVDEPEPKLRTPRDELLV
jgi:nitroreductase / dihydropteridine reductase